MSIQREIVQRLFESRGMSEASFEANGSTYKSAFGRYHKDDEQISREDYFDAKEDSESEPVDNEESSEPSTILNTTSMRKLMHKYDYKDNQELDFIYDEYGLEVDEDFEIISEQDPFEIKFFYEDDPEVKRFKKDMAKF